MPLETSVSAVLDAAARAHLLRVHRGVEKHPVAPSSIALARRLLAILRCVANDRGGSLGITRGHWLRGLLESWRGLRDYIKRRRNRRLKKETIVSSVI